MGLDRILNSAKGPEYYREQIQVFTNCSISSCIIFPDLCGQSWTLLGELAAAGHALWRGLHLYQKLFSTKNFQAKLYDFIHHCAWTEAELKPFVIQEDEEEDD